MSKKLIYLMFVALVLALAHSGWGTTKIIVVTDTPGNEEGLEPFLKEILGNDIAVEMEAQKYQDTLGAGAKANLSSADLIIVSRKTSSGSYDEDIEFWNGLETPILLTSAFLSRDNRWRWLTSDKAEVALTHVAVIDASDPIFNGVTIIDGQVEIFSTPVTGTDFSAQGSAGNGTKIATPAGADLVMIARWDAGTEYYPGSGQIAGGPRMFFGMEPAGIYFPVITADGKKMLENAILLLLGPFGDSIALDPSPADAQTALPLDDVVLAWTPGELSNTHDLYFGERFEDVNTATLASPEYKGNLTETTYALGRLDFGKTYYWRVDEVSAPPDSTVFKGDIWQFTIEPFAYPIAGENITATASNSNTANEGPENTVNGSGLDSDDLHSMEQTDMWISGPEPSGAWIEFEFDRIYKVYEMWVWNHNTSLELALGFGVKDATIEYSIDGANWTTLGTTHEFARALGTPGYATNTTVDFGGMVAKYVKITANSNWGGFLNQYGLSEVRFFYIPLPAREPQPESGATDVDLDVVLNWRAGREAAKHDVYFSDDWQAVVDGTAPVTTVTETSHGPVALDLGTTYYWRIDEVNEAETPATLEGDIWDFTTYEYFVVDDFEDYNDYPPDEIFSTWIDGYGTTTNGSTAGYPEPDWNAGEHYVETTIVHGGAQSMPFFYDNNFKYSEATMTLSSQRDWTIRGVGVLSLWFYGDASNAAERMYVALNGSAVVYHDNPNAALINTWTEWTIDLQDFAAQGVNLANVNTISIGFGDKNNLQAGGSGMVFFDDIRLYRSAP